MNIIWSFFFYIIKSRHLFAYLNLFITFYLLVYIFILAVLIVCQFSNIIYIQQKHTNKKLTNRRIFMIAEKNLNKEVIRYLYSILLLLLLNKFWAVVHLA